MASCKDCEKQIVCKFKPIPYEGIDIPLKEFANKLYRLYGTFCIHYRKQIARKEE